jgi:hypothetical protein
MMVPLTVAPAFRVGELEKPSAWLGALVKVNVMQAL